MDLMQPLVEDISVDAKWSGDVSEPMSLEISVDVAVNSRSHLALIQSNHPSILSAQVIGIAKIIRRTEAVPQYSPGGHHAPFLTRETLDSPNPFPIITDSINQRRETPFAQPGGKSGTLMDMDPRGNSDTIKGKAVLPSVPSDQQGSPVDLTEVALFAQTASLYETTSSRDSALSPPPPLTSKKLTIPKRRSFEPKPLHALQQESPQRQILSEKDSKSPQSLQKQPVSLEKRPPWRPVGAEDTTLRGRKQLGTDVAQRRISRSTGTSQMERGRTRQRQSSLPGRVTKAERGLQNVQVAEHEFNAQTLPRVRLTKIPMRTGLRDRDTTVKVTRYAEASERLERWLDDRRNQSPPEILSPDGLVSDHDVPFPIASSEHSSGPALSPSPTPSSRAALPWTSIRGIRGGCMNGSTYDASTNGDLNPTLVDDNGTLFVYFQGSNMSNLEIISFRIKIQASIKLEAQASGCHSLLIPSLPLQSGKATGTFNLSIVTRPSSEEDNFKAYEKVAYVDDNFATHPLQYDQICHAFPLNRPFIINLLCFEACRLLEPAEFEIDNDVRTRYDWEDLEGDGIIAEHSMICSLRLHPFLMWAEYVKLKLYLIGGPSGILETSLSPGNRRLYLDGKRCDAEHELEISLTCSIADLQKTFTISWEQSLGAAPFEVWLPRISGLYRKKLDDIFDLPGHSGTLIAPRPCQKSRVYSMTAQERFLKSCEEVFFFPENQHTPRSIQQSLEKQSGQFYDELTAQDSESVSSTPLGGEIIPALKGSFITLNPNKRTRTGSTNLLEKAIIDCSHRPSKIVPQEEGSMTATSKQSATNSTEFTPVKAGPRERNHFWTRITLFVLDAVRWLFSRLAAPARLLKLLFVIWLCLRAFDNAHIVRVEQSMMSSAKAAWNRCNFEPVELYGDFTGWRHLMEKINQGASSIFHDGHLGVLSPIDTEPERMPRNVEFDGSSDAGSVDTEQARKEGEAQTTGTNDDGSAAENSDIPDPMPKPANPSGGISSSPKTGDADDVALTLLDRIDRALGWKPRAGGW